MVALAGFGAFAQSPDFHIYLAFGQSNMDGGPQVSGLVTPSRFQVMQSVNCPGLSPSRTKGSWYTAVPPISRCTQGPGLAYWFGRTLADSLPANIKIGIINVAVLGCKIELFDKDTYQAYAGTVEPWMTTIINEYGGNPYGRMVEVAKLAQKDGVIKGILIHQGESNNGDQQWPDKVKGVYDDLMADLKLDPRQGPPARGRARECRRERGHRRPQYHHRQAPDRPSQLLCGLFQRSRSPHRGPDAFLGRGIQGVRQAVRGDHAYGPGEGTDQLASGSGAPVFHRGPHLLSRKSGFAVPFEISRRSFVTLNAYDMEGREIARLAGTEFPAGRHSVEFGRTALPAGFSFLRMEADGFTETWRVFLSPE